VVLTSYPRLSVFIRGPLPFDLLIAAGFRPNFVVNKYLMSNHNSRSGPIDLLSIARQAMLEAGFVPDIPPEVSREVQILESKPAASTGQTRDLRKLLWSSIDDRKSRDLDQVEYAERLQNGNIRVLVGIADVDNLVTLGSAIDDHARRNSTSVYTGVRTFHMLPEELSTDLTSLVEAADRAAIIIEMTVSNDGRVTAIDVYQALVHNYAKLSYEAVGAWLDHGGPLPEGIAKVPNMEAQIRTQTEAAQRLHEMRLANGALTLDTIKAVPVVDESGKVKDLAVTERNSARDLIENFMIAANVAMAQFLEAKQAPLLRRVVRTPTRWDRIVELARELGAELPTQPDSRALARFLESRRASDPDHFPDLSIAIVKLLGPGEYTVQTAASLEDTGHFGLAVNDYTHSTAPNRRFADLVTQRSVKAALRNDPAPYSESQLTEIAQHCTEREDAARKVERKMRKVAAALLLHDRIGSVFDAIVTGVSSKGTFARTIKPPVDGRIVRREDGLQVGNKVHVKLIDTDARRGFIDFERI